MGRLPVTVSESDGTKEQEACAIKKVCYYAQAIRKVEIP
jgi:hypothetical protein